MNLARCILLVSLWLSVPFTGFGGQFLPTIEDTIEIEEWLYTGPFLVGAREGITGVIEDVESFSPTKGMKHRNVLTQGGVVEWKKTTPDSTGWVNLEYEDVLWDSLMDMYGVAAILNVGYAYCEFESDGRRKALAVAERVGSFYLNGKPYPGDPYGHGYMRIPVVLKDGVNRILVAVGGYGEHRFLFKFVPAPAPLILISEEATLPDLIEGEPMKSWGGITLLNTTENWLRDFRVVVGEGKAFKKTERTIAKLAPGCVLKVPVEIELNEPIWGSENPAEMEEIWLPVRVHISDSIYEDSLKLRIRSPGESYKLTFISNIDRSCQYYAVLPPVDYDPDDLQNSQKKYALILTLHGAGVKASGLVDCYRAKDWAFVVAPTNRRRFGFDWQDWGRLDALEVLADAKSRFPIDENRVYLTGHSMGGHGVWHIALTHPDLFAAAAPEAGWISFELYIPWFFQRSYIFAEPTQLAIRDMSLREDFTLNFVENALNLPLFILHGGLDDNVPTLHARMFAKNLNRLGYEYVYKEVPGVGHWFQVDKVNNISCVDDPELVDFLKSKTRNPYPKHIIYKTSDIGQNNKIYWIEIEEQTRPFYESRIEASVEENEIAIVARNISQFDVELTHDLLDYGRIIFDINGDQIPYNFEEDVKLTFHKTPEGFRIGGKAYQGLRKTPEFYGPIKQVYFSPFILVYGTRGDSAVADLTLHQARLEAFRWWRRGNGFAEICADTEVTEELISDYNLILFGGAKDNLIVRRISEELPIRVEDGKIFLDEDGVGSELSAEYIYPNPLNPSKFVFIHAGTDIERLKLSTFFGAIHSGAGLPDFLIFSDEVKEKGWGGVRCAGYFNSEWKLDSGLMYYQK